MSENGYTAVVGVRKRKTASDPHERFCVCRVPDGKIVDAAALVLYGADDCSEYEKGVCISDTLFVDSKTLELLQTVTGSAETLPEIKALINLEWIAEGRFMPTKRRDAVE